MGKAIRILYVEDVPGDAELVLHKISGNKINFTHTIVKTKEDYIEALISFIPDLILSEYSLPDFDWMNGLSLRNEISPQTPFILVTDSINEEVAIEFMKAGADDYIPKSNLTRLIPSIKAAFEKRETILLRLDAEADLRDNEEKFKIAKQSPLISEGIKELSGYPSWDFLMNRVRSFTSLIFVDDKEAVMKSIRDALNDMNPFTVEYRIVSAKGDIKWIWVRGRGVFAGGKIIAIEGFFTDITGKKKQKKT